MAQTQQLQQAYIQIQCQAFDKLTENSENWSTLRVWNERYKQRRILADLPDDLLRDVGISRADAILESKKSFWQE